MAVVLIQNADDLIRPSYATKLFLAIAYECGVFEAIRNAVNIVQTDIDLLRVVKAAIADDHPILANSLDVDAVRVIIDHLEDVYPVSPIVITTDLPELTTQAGPSTVTGDRKIADPTLYDLVFPDYPIGYSTYEIYVSGILAKQGNDMAVSGDITVTTDYTIADDGDDKYVRIVYIRTSDGALSQSSTPLLFLGEAGPTTIRNGRNGTTSTTIDIFFDEPPTGYTYEIFLDDVSTKTGSTAGVGGVVQESLTSVTDDSNDHEVIIRYIRSSDSRPGRYSSAGVFNSLAAPTSVTASRNGVTATTIDITFDEPASGYSYEIFIDDVYQKTGNVAGVGGTVTETVEDYTDDAQQHGVKVVFKRDSDGAYSVFSTATNFT